MTERLGTVRGKLLALDGLRGVAASWVVIHHLRTNNLVEGGRLVLNGSMLVDTFFVVSGFVMAYQYAARIRSAGDARDFVRRRVARIWPLHACILVLMFLPRLAKLLLYGDSNSQLLVDGSNHSLTSFIASLLLIHAMGLYRGAVWNGPSWTISVEFFTYLVFVLLAWQKPWVLRWGSIIIVTGVGVILTSSGLYLSPPVQLSFFRCLFGFFLGCMSFFGFRRIRNADRSVRQLTGLEVAGSSTAIALIWIGPSTPLSLLFPPACAFVVVLLAMGGGKVALLLEARIAQALGAWSLGIYLIHIPLLNILFNVSSKASRVGLNFNPVSWTWVETTVFLLLLLILSSAAHFFIEKPMRSWLTQGMGGRTKQSDDAIPNLTGNKQ
jgi:peptidoglycan/LPS O-acetylase OafA/YrhL